MTSSFLHTSHMRLRLEDFLLLSFRVVAVCSMQDQVHSQSSAITWQMSNHQPEVCVRTQLTFQLQDGIMRSAVPSSDSIPSTVVPQTLQNPCGCDDRGCPTGHPPFIGRQGTDGGTQTSQATNKSQDLEAWHLDIPNVLKISFNGKK